MAELGKRVSVMFIITVLWCINLEIMTEYHGKAGHQSSVLSVLLSLNDCKMDSTKGRVPPVS